MVNQKTDPNKKTKIYKTTIDKKSYIHSVDLILIVDCKYPRITPHLSNFCFYDPGPLQEQSQLTPKYHKSHWQRPRLSVFVASFEFFAMQKTRRLFCRCPLQRNSSGTSETSKTSAHCIAHCWNMCHCDRKMYHKDLAQLISPYLRKFTTFGRLCDKHAGPNHPKPMDSNLRQQVLLQLQFHEYSRTQSLTLQFLLILLCRSFLSALAPLLSAQSLVASPTEAK